MKELVQQFSIRLHFDFYVPLPIDNVPFSPKAKFKLSPNYSNTKRFICFICYSHNLFLTVLLSCHVRVSEWIYTIQLSECQGTPCSKQARYLKGCVRYIFTSLFCMPKRKDLWNKEKKFLFHFKSSFRSWDDQILNFQIFKCHDDIQMPKHETRNPFHWITWEANTAWQWNFASLCHIRR